MAYRYVRTYNVMSQLSDWKRAHMCTENHVCFGRIHGSQLREGANTGQHTPTLSLPPSHHCLDGEVYRGNRHYNVCEHVGLDTNQSLHHPPERDVLGSRSPEVGPPVDVASSLHNEWDKVRTYVHVYHGSTCTRILYHFLVL